MRARLAAAAFLGFFFLYIGSMPPGLAPYRDAGEFAVAAHTLGVAHPPSYPLYVLFGRAADALPAATTAYRLGLLSAACGAGAAAIVAWAAAAAGPWAGLAAGLAFGLGAVPWSVAIVQEMYALMALLAAALLAAGLALGERFSARGWLGACFLYGLALGNRTDLLLWAPGLLVLALPAAPGARLLARGAAAGLAGLSVYAFLPLRSAGGPWLDWNHPAALDGFIGSITRRGYGGTLDLLSKSYRTGENFLPNLEAYAGHLRWELGLPVLLLALAGAAALSRTRPRRFAGTLLLYVLSGPVFLWLANMPPNPHALAIVHPHYLLSDMVLALWAAQGVASAAERSGSRAVGRPQDLGGGTRPGSPAVAALLCACVVLGAAVTGRFGRMDRRWDLFAHDWADGALRSVPPGAALVAKKDVQIFSLWHHQKVLGRRPDVVAVAQGLAHSPWHQEALRRAGAPARMTGLRGSEEWRAFLESNPSVWVTMDAEVPAGLPAPGSPRGLAAPIPERTAPDAWPFLVLRGDARYEARPDFFSADVVESYAAAGQRRGAALLARGGHDAAARELRRAWSLKRRSPEAADLLAFMALSRGDAAAAAGLYGAAARLYDETLALTLEYKSLPETRRGIAAAAADSAVNFGVALEREGRRADAEAQYLRALALKPSLARARFNLAVLYWDRDWRRVVSELEAALAAEPGYAEAARYLAQARARLAAGR